MDATSSLQALIVFCYYCFSQQCIAYIFFQQVHYVYKCLCRFTQRKIMPTRKKYNANSCCRLNFYTAVKSLICLTFNKRRPVSFSVLSSLCFLSGFSDALPSAVPPVSFNRFSIPLCGSSSSTLNWNRQIQQLR